MSAGITLKAADIKIGKTPGAALPTGAFSKVEEVLDRPVTRTIPVDEPILEGRLAPRDSGVGLASIIPLGMRGVAVGVDDVGGVASFVRPAPLQSSGFCQLSC